MRYPALWFTSRSAILEGQTHCAYGRWLGYHAGPHGTGWRRKQTAVPLATGSAVHTGVELLGKWIMEADVREAPARVAAVSRVVTGLPHEVIAWAAIEAASQYENRTRKSGLLLALGDALSNADQDHLILEQRTLIEGLVWLWALVRLPILLRDYRLLNVEKEESIVLDCTCGLGEAISDWRVHDKRKCAGIVQMGRADLLWESRESSNVIYEELKTKSTPNMGWELAWEHSGQLNVNMEAASRRLGKSVSGALIDVLYKGRRDKPKGAGPEVRKTQQSALCYGIYEPGGLGSSGLWRPRMDREHWANTVPIWDENIPLSPVRDGASRVESWVTSNIASLAKAVQTLGPFPRPMALIPQALDSVRASERRWRVDVEDVRSLVHPADVVFDRSWQCTNFDGSPCFAVPICFKQPGWESPGEMGIYEPRTPHHTAEKEAFEACGMVFADESGDAE